MALFSFRRKGGLPAAAEALPLPDPGLVFEHAYVRPPPGLRNGF